MDSHKLLAVFDFDHTLVDGNTDTWILDLYPPCRQQMKQQKSEGVCWTDIMYIPPTFFRSLKMFFSRAKNSCTQIISQYLLFPALFSSS